MEYELVIKFWRKSLAGEAFLATIESDLAAALGPLGTVDGFDTSANEINLFVQTDDPKLAFRRVKDVLENGIGLKGVSAASRLVGGAGFTSLWPLRATRKFQLP